MIKEVKFGEITKIKRNILNSVSLRLLIFY